MKLTIITPVHRVENLLTIAKTIPKEVDWVCVYSEVISSELNEFAICLHLPPVKSNWGVAKVNFALDFVRKGFIYVLDDDTVLHEDFDVLLELSPKFDFIHFNQQYKNGVKRTGGFVKRGHIDIGNFIVRRDLIGNTFLSETDSMPDGLWAEQLYKKCKTPIYLNRIFSTYNYLR